MKHSGVERCLLHIIRYDLFMGFTSNRIKFCAAGLCVIALTAMFLTSLDVHMRYIQSVGGVVSGGFEVLDVLAFFAAGSDYYQADEKTPFLLPIGWMIQQILIAALVGSYVSKDLETNAPQILIRIRERWAWWLSKCLWVVATVFAFYAIELGVAFIITTIFGGTTGKMSDIESAGILGFVISDLNVESLTMLFVLPVILSITLSLAQVSLALIVGPFMAFTAVTAFMTVSVYFGSPFLIGDCSMIARSSFVQPGGIDTATALLSCVALGLVSGAIGGLIFKRKDIVGKQELT